MQRNPVDDDVEPPGLTGYVGLIEPGGEIGGEVLAEQTELAVGMVADRYELATSQVKAEGLTVIFPILGTILAVEVIWVAGYTLRPKKQAIAK